MRNLHRFRSVHADRRYSRYYCKNKYVGPAYCWAEMHAGRVACYPLVNHGEYAPRTLIPYPTDGHSG